MMLTSIVSLSCAVIGLTIATAAVARCARKARVARFESRELLSVSELCKAFFPDIPPDTVVKCLATISRITGIDAGRLRPTDRFKVELKLSRGNFIAGEWDDIEEEIAKKCGQVTLQRKILTIGDYIALIGSTQSVQACTDLVGRAQ